MNHQVALSNKRGILSNTAQTVDTEVWSCCLESAGGKSRTVSKRKMCSKSISKTTADSDGKKVMNILQAGSARLHSRWHSLIYRAYQKPSRSRMAEGKPCVWLFISSLLVGSPVTGAPPASGQSQAHYSVNWTFKCLFWNGVPLLRFGSECFRLETGHARKLFCLQYGAGSLEGADMDFCLMLS